MKSTTTLPRLCFWGTVALTLAGITLRSIAMGIFYDADVGYFRESILPILCQIISVLAVLFPCILCIITPKTTYPTTWTDFGGNRIAILPGCLLSGFGLFQVISNAMSQENSSLVMASGVLGLGAAVYFFLTLAAGMRQKAATLSAVGYFAIFWALSCLAETYFDLFTTMNSPVKMILQFGFLSVALMAIAELRFRLGKAAPRMAVCAHGMAVYFCLTAGVSTIVAAICHGNAISTTHLLYAVALIGMGVYAAFRLVTYLFVLPDENEQISDTTLDDIPQNNDGEVVS